MIEKLLMILDKVTDELLLLLETPFIELTLVHLLIVVAMATGIYFFVKHAVKAFFAYGLKGAELTAKPVKFLYARHKEHSSHKMVCSVCKNPIRDCTCPNNRGVSYRKRLKKWRKAKALLIENERARRKALKESNTPVVLKQRNKGGR